jgi:hypothetical protein
MSSKQETTSLLKEFVNCTSQFLESLIALGEGRVPKQSPEQLITKMTDIDRKLQISAKKMEEQRRRYQEILALQEQVKQKDNEIITLASHLLNAEAILQQILDEAKPVVEAIEKTSNRQVSVEDIIEYSHRISMTTSAPPTEELPNEIFSRYRLPFPSEVEMQQTLLYTEMGETKKAPTVEPMAVEMPETHSKLLPVIKLELDDVPQNTQSSPKTNTDGTQTKDFIKFELDIENM